MVNLGSAGLGTLSDRSPRSRREVRQLELAFGAEVLLQILPALTPEDLRAVERSVRQLYRRYKQGKRDNLPALGEALARIGRWPECLEVLTHVPGQEFPPVAAACTELALALPDDAEREQVLNRLLSMRSDRLAPPRIVVAAEGSADFAARVALALARAGHPRAREFLSQAVAPSLSLVPGNDGGDSLRLMVAMALAAEGKLESAERVSRSCMWMSERIACLHASARALPVDVEGQRRFAVAIADVLASPGDLLGLALSEACGAVIYFAPSLSVEPLAPPPAHDVPHLEFVRRKRPCRRVVGLLPGPLESSAHDGAPPRSSGRMMARPDLGSRPDRPHSARHSSGGGVHSVICWSCH